MVPVLTSFDVREEGFFFQQMEYSCMNNLKKNQAKFVVLINSSPHSCSGKNMWMSHVSNRALEHYVTTEYLLLTKSCINIANPTYNHNESWDVLRSITTELGL